MSALPAPAPSLCASCGAAFTCGMAAGDSLCWCFSLPQVLAVPDAASPASCLCPACLAAAIALQGD